MTAAKSLGKRTLLLLSNILLSIFIGVEGFVNSPKIITKDGNLIFETGLNRNISFRLKGASRFTINDEYDLLELMRSARNNAGWRNSTIRGGGNNLGPGWNSFQEEADWRTASADLASLKLRVFGEDGLNTRLLRLQNRTRRTTQEIRKYQRLLQNVETKLQTMYDQLELDNCKSNPCENGGTCFNMFNGFVCKCTKNFEGPTCDKDVNECALFTGTDLGCQNGGQCVNQFGGYNCICSPGWFGIHCTQRKGDCLQSSAWELCGHGTCVSNNDNFGYKCVCDQGWKTNGLTPACTVDVDECSESHPPCATRCINLPGSFTCAPCAAGLTGSGMSCRDVDECAQQNGGCSLSPRVACINSYGSFHCGECPIGWIGDGRTCTRTSNNNDNDGSAINIAGTSCTDVNICHPDATCSVVSNTLVCTCPLGMVGSGIGANGCVRGETINCNSSPCQNGGTCIDRDGSYICLCPRGYRAPNCTPLASPCQPNPCKNGGRCIAGVATDFQCQCPAGFSGRLCNTRFSRCGGILTGMLGRFKYPPGELYEHSAQCAWLLRTNETFVLNVTFNSFELEDSSECRFDWLQINDGRSAAAQLIGRFCGNRKPLGGNIISTTNHLYMWFRSDNSTARAGFDLSWNSIPPVCGGLITFETHGTIKTPGSPGNYPKNRDCRWQLRAPNTKRIKLTFFSLQIENHDSCNFDYVEITDAISGVVLEKFCNSSHPSPLTLPTNEVDIYFHSDNDGGDTGFQIYYSTEQRIPDCGGTYTAKEASIRSPDPSIIQESISCEYDIKMAAGESIRFEFTKFDMGPDDCVEIYDLHTGNQIRSLQGKYCGGFDINVEPFSSLYNALQLKLYSKGGTFELKYIADCSYIFESSSDVITSPSYPKISKTERLCTYKIITEPDTVISLHWVDFELLDSSLHDNDCAFSYLKLKDGLNREEHGPYCGNNTPAIDLATKSNMLELDFQTAITSSGRGFKLEYRAVPVEKTDCGGIYTKPGYSIRLPTGDDGHYMHDMKCYWIIMAPRGRGILLNWKSFKLEQSSDCTYDYVEIYDSLADSENDKPLGRYCDTRPPPAILTHSRILMIKFVSDMSDALDGFEVSYEFIDYAHTCGGEILSSSGELASPGWPYNYTNGVDCVWTIVTPAGTQLELQIETFDVEQAKGCGNDWLEIRNGGTSNSSLVGFYCGSSIPRLIPSFTNQMRLHFHSDAFVNARGFKLKWYIFSNGCGGLLNSDLGVITSPLYPNPYPNNAQCEWRVNVNAGSSIHFTIEDLSMEELFHCSYDHLDIFDGRTKIHPILARVCSIGNNSPRSFVTSSNEALVRFTTDSSNTERGFFLSYYSNCTRTIKALHGAIESPNYGNSFHRSSVNCTWTIKAPKGNRIHLEFTHFDSLDGSQVYLTDVTQNGSIQHVIKMGQSFNSSGDTLVVKQNSSGVVFRLEYAMVGCINVFHREEGEIYSPNHPRTYPNDIECVWEIRAQIGQGIKLKIEDMDIEESVNCTRDGLMISSDPESKNPKERHCGTQADMTITSDVHRLFLRFYSDAANNGKGFHVMYTTQKSTCGGQLSSQNGIIQSPNYPQNYPANSDCEWYVGVSNSHSITFTMEELDLEQYYDCEMDYVELYDYSLEDVEPIEWRKLFKKCGELKNESNTWTTASSDARVVFKSDDSEQSKGFKLSFKENCGGRILISDDNLNYLNLVRHTQENATCVWNLIAKDNTQHVVFDTNHVQLNPAVGPIYKTEEDCTDHGVKIFDGDDETAPLKEKFCTTHPPSITSSGHSLTISVSLYTISQFFGYYQLMDNLCGNSFTAVRGKFASPQYPLSYPFGIECEWTIEASEGNAIALTFESMDLEQSDDCNNDYVEVRESNHDGRLMGVFCGKTVPPTLESANSLWIKFSSDDDNVGDGFLASYSYVMHNELTGERGVIASPKYPTKFFSHEAYSYRITVDREYVILVTISHVVDTDMPFIKFYDGYSNIGNQIDYANTYNLHSNTNILYITATRGPFKFEWQRLAKEEIRTNQTAEEKAKICGSETLRVENTLLFNSPGYPNGYDPGMDCSWIAMASNPAKHVVLTIAKLDLEDFSNCMADSLSVSSSSDLVHWENLGKHCKMEANSNLKYEGRPYLKLDFVTDATISKIGFSTFLHTECGSDLTGHSGLINITELLGNSVHRYKVECVWTIRVRQGHRIRINFPESYLHNPNETTNACNTYFLVRNGINNDSPFLGQGNYCENDIAQQLESTSNRAYIKFVSSAFAKFIAAFYYEEISHECSDYILLSDATDMQRSKTITTPKYPNIPNPHSECIWKIVAPVNHVIALDFIGTFDLASTGSVNGSCDREFVQVNDGASELRPLLGRFCGNTKPDTIYSTGSQMRIKYFTDIAEPHMGFKANVSIGRCGGSYYTNEGSISSPVDLKVRGTMLEFECVYTIELPAGNTINLTMDSIDLPESDDCENVSHLELQEINMYDDSGEVNITDILRICGRVPRRYIVETNKLVIRYKIKENPSFSTYHFKMSYSSIGSRCGETIQASQGVLQTPGYPSGVSKPMHCLWRIRVPKGRRIKIEFLDFDTDGSSNDTSFGYDDIRRFRGRLTFSNDFQMQSLIARVASNPPAQIYSTDNTMAIDAFLLPFNMHRGFKLRFSSNEPSFACAAFSENLEDEEGSLEFKRDNDTSVYCSYPVKMSENETLAIHVEKYEKYSEFLSNSFCALVSPFKIEFNSKELVPGLLCKNDTQPSIRLPFPATLKLSGNKRNKLRELVLQYKVHKCGGIIKIMSGDNLTITRPEMENQNDGALECAWVVWPAGVEEDFENMDMYMEDVQLVVQLATDLKGSCEDEYLLLYNGPDHNAPQLGRFCQQSSATNLVVEHGLFFEYVTKNYALKSNFNLSTAPGSGCGGKLNYPYRIIVFADEYKNNVECIWEIVAEPGFHLGLTFEKRFFIESSPDCKKDYLLIQQRESFTDSWVDLHRLCGREPPKVINTTTTEMRLIFRSDADIIGDGFTARFERNCGGILYATNEKQTLESPGYPNKYGNNLLCNYTILPKDSSSAGIFVRFLDFELEHAPVSACVFDNVTVYTKDRYKNPTETVLCDTKTGMEFRAKELISVVLRTDSSFAYKGFQLEYSINLCGAVITNSTKIQSPRQNHDSSYPAGSSCYWNLTAPAGYKIMIKFEELDFESQMYCLYDGVEIFQGLVPVGDQRMGKFCGNLTGHLPTLNIPSNTALIHSYSDEQDPSRGFTALVDFKINCDRQIFLDTNNSSYTFNTYAGNYENNLDCSYIFSTKPGRQLEIQFSSFHIEERENCTDDYLEVRDGAGVFADSIGQFCGHLVPEILRSSNNVVFMRFVSDSAVTSTGFEAIIKSMPKQCGDHALELNTTQTIELKSPDNGSGKYLPNVNCFWKIKAENNIHLHFEKLDLQGPNSNGECAYDFLKFYNKEDAEKIEHGYGSSVVFNGVSGSQDMYSYALQHVYCGSILPDDYFTSSKEIYVKFQSDNTVEKSGFKLIASVATGCFRNFTGTQGRIVLAETEDHCDIFIKAPANYSLTLYYADLTFSENDCSKEYLEVFDAKTNTSLQKNCESISTASSLFTNYNELRLRIHMGGFYTQFDITYLGSTAGAGCGGNLYNTAGIITSPFYPNNVRENSDCRWNIQVPNNVHVFLNFDVFDLGAKATCHSDYLQIIEYNTDGTGSVVRQFCGEDQPTSYKSNKNYVTIRFHKTVNYDGTGWVIRFNGVYANYKVPQYNTIIA